MSVAGKVSKTEPNGDKENFDIMGYATSVV